jgi:hypothetical protein
VEDVRLLCLDLVTNEMLGSHMSVTRRVKAVACLALSWWVGDDSQGGGANILEVFEVECGRGVKRHRRSDCIA